MSEPDVDVGPSQVEMEETVKNRIEIRQRIMELSEKRTRSADKPTASDEDEFGTGAKVISALAALAVGLYLTFSSLWSEIPVTFLYTLIIMGISCFIKGRHQTSVCSQTSYTSQISEAGLQTTINGEQSTVYSQVNQAAPARYHIPDISSQVRLASSEDCHQQEPSDDHGATGTGPAAEHLSLNEPSPAVSKEEENNKLTDNVIGKPKKRSRAEIPIRLARRTVLDPPIGQGTKPKKRIVQPIIRPHRCSLSPVKTTSEGSPKKGGKNFVPDFRKVWRAQGDSDTSQSPSPMKDTSQTPSPMEDTSQMPSPTKEAAHAENLQGQMCDTSGTGNASGSNVNRNCSRGNHGNCDFLFGNQSLDSPSPETIKELRAIGLRYETQGDQHFLVDVPDVEDELEENAEKGRIPFQGDPGYDSEAELANNGTQGVDNGAEDVKNEPHVVKNEPHVVDNGPQVVDIGSQVVDNGTPGTVNGSNDAAVEEWRIETGKEANDVNRTSNVDDRTDDIDNDRTKDIDKGKQYIDRGTNPTDLRPTSVDAQAQTPKFEVLLRKLLERQLQKELRQFHKKRSRLRFKYAREIEKLKREITGKNRIMSSLQLRIPTLEEENRVLTENKDKLDRELCEEKDRTQSLVARLKTVYDKLMVLNSMRNQARLDAVQEHCNS